MVDLTRYSEQRKGPIGMGAVLAVGGVTQEPMQSSETFLIHGWLLTNIVYYLLNLATSATNSLIYFSRHGQSIANLGNLVGTDFGLSQNGINYAQELGHWFRKHLIKKKKKRLLAQQEEKDLTLGYGDDDEGGSGGGCSDHGNGDGDDCDNTPPFPIDLTIYCSTLRRVTSTAKMVYDELVFGEPQPPYIIGFDPNQSQFYAPQQPPQPSISLQLASHYLLQGPFESHPVTPNGKTRFSVNLIKWRALNEVDAGIFDGLSYAQIKQLDPMGYASRSNDKFNYRYKMGESYKDVIDRLQGAVIFELERVQARHKLSIGTPGHNNSTTTTTKPKSPSSHLPSLDHPKILVISHQAIIRACLGYFLNTEKEDIPTIDVPLNHIICVKTDNFPARAQLISVSESIRTDLAQLGKNNSNGMV